MWPQFVNMLSWWQWLILAAVPPAIILLYFLKLKRLPLEVPSTYLWHRSIEDLHVNTIWQRLRNNLLLWLQILLLLLLALALLRPGWKGTQLVGKRFVFLIDCSASMQATDGGKSRLDRAKDQVRGLIQNHMQSGDVAMVVSFADSARVEQPFTDNRARLADAVDGIQPTQRTTSLADAFKVASGLANPGRAGEDVTDVKVAEALPATLYVFSDGRFPDLENVSLGNLTEKFVQMADPVAENVAVTAFSVRREEGGHGHLQAFARLEYFGPKDAPKKTVGVELFHDGELVDAAELAIASGESDSAVFPLGTLDSGVLRIQARAHDHLTLDDEAWVVVRPPGRARVLLVTPGNEPLQTALSTTAAGELADVEVQGPAYLKDKAYPGNAAAGLYDLVIYDRCQPAAMPQANTFFIGELPPGPLWKSKPKVAAPAIIDTDPAHPLMQWLNLGDVIVAEGTPLETPPGGRVLIDTDAGSVLSLVPREGYEDLVMGMVLIDEEEGKRVVGTNWIIRPSFPSFVLNVLQYLGRGGDVLTGDAVHPGEPVTLRAPAAERSVRVVGPDRRAVRLAPIKPGEFSFTDTDRLGVYDAQFASEPHRPFTVNLFHPDESDIRGRNFRIGHVDVVAETKWEGVRKEAWKFLVLAGVGILLTEWYLYGRRVRM